jgi:hypothetical protein
MVTKLERSQAAWWAWKLDLKTVVCLASRTVEMKERWLDNPSVVLLAGHKEKTMVAS